MSGENCVIRGKGPTGYHNPKGNCLNIDPYEWRFNSVVTAKREGLKCAKELGYPSELIEKIKMAEGFRELTDLMEYGRRNYL